MSPCHVQQVLELREQLREMEATLERENLLLKMAEKRKQLEMLRNSSRGGGGGCVEEPGQYRLDQGGARQDRRPHPLDALEGGGGQGGDVGVQGVL